MQRGRAAGLASKEAAEGRAQPCKRPPRRGRQARHGGTGGVGSGGRGGVAGREAAGERRREPSRKNGESQPNSHTQRRPANSGWGHQHTLGQRGSGAAPPQTDEDQIFAKETGAGEVAVGSFERGKGGGWGLAAPARHGGSCTKVSRLRLLLLRLRPGPAAGRPKATRVGGVAGAQGSGATRACTPLRLVGRTQGLTGPGASRSAERRHASCSVPATQWREAT